MGAVKGIFKAVLWLGVPLLAIAGVLQYFFVDRMVLGHDAMAPTVFAGDTIFVWRGTAPQFGHVVVCDHPTRSGVLVIGRVVGSAGKTVDTHRGELRVQGDVPSKDVSGTVTWVDPETSGRHSVVFGTEKLGNFQHGYFQDPEGLRLRATTLQRGVYLLGDNRVAKGQDSRFFGPVNETTCRGRAVLRWSTAELLPAELPSRPYFEFL